VTEEDGPARELVFVYNADSGLFNAMADAAHKLLSPDTYSCNLCRVTYGWVAERGAWRDFVRSLPLPCTFLHRDEFRSRYQGVDTPLPAVLVVRDGEPTVCIDAATLNSCADLDALMELVRRHCARGGPAVA
jgi:hypothetical protein